MDINKTADVLTAASGNPMKSAAEPRGCKTGSSLIRRHAEDSFIWDHCYISLYAGLEKKGIRIDSKG